MIDAVSDAVDLPGLVGRYVPLKRSGTKEWKACCPFHQEKTASFYVVPEKGMWHCFGCGKGGSAFTFLMEREGMTFPEAVRTLARETGIALPEDDDPAATAQAARLARLREVMERACKFYERALRSDEGARARAYLERRGITEETVAKFRLGYAPPGWQNLLDAAKDGGVTEDDLIDLGLARRKDAEEGRPARTFDMFRDRVTFPICDTQGRVIAFGARTLGDDEPKYLNSPESALFSKSRTVYALHLAKTEMLRGGEGAVMEGYTDVIMAHQCGWPVAVAGLGTALTSEQAALVARYARRVHLVYDGDAAGQRAAERNAPVFLPQELEARVAVLPAGEDPCDTLRRGGLPALRAAVDAGREAFDHLLTAKAAAHDMESVPGKAQALDEALEILAPVTSEVRRTLYLGRVAETYGIHADVVAHRFRELRSRAAPRPPVRPAPAAEAPAAGQERAPPPRPAGPPPAVEAHLLEALLGSPGLCAEAAERLPRDAVTHVRCRALLDRLLDAQDETGEPPRVDALIASIEDPELAAFAAGVQARGGGKDLARQGRDCMARLAAQHEVRQLRKGVEGVGAGGDLSADEADALRRWVDVHRRRSGAAEGQPGP